MSPPIPPALLSREVVPVWSWSGLPSNNACKSAVAGSRSAIPPRRSRMSIGELTIQRFQNGAEAPPQPPRTTKSEQYPIKPAGAATTAVSEARVDSARESRFQATSATVRRTRAVPATIDLLKVSRSELRVLEGTYGVFTVVAPIAQTGRHSGIQRAPARWLVCYRPMPGSCVWPVTHVRIGRVDRRRGPADYTDAS